MDLAQVTEMTEVEAREYLEAVRWPNGPVCPREDCGSENVAVVRGTSGRPGLKRCLACKKQFTVTVGTIFEDSHIGIRKWVMAFHLVCSSKKGISALQLQRNLGLKSYKSAWFMAHRIRYAMSQEPLKGMLTGAVEVDETFVGGKPRNAGKHKGPIKGIRDRKTPLMALVERGGRIKTRVVANVTPENLQQAIEETVDPNALLYSDGWPAYRTIAAKRGQRHEWVDHSKKEYARGEAHVNTCESFFGLFKRGVMGAFHHVSREHLHRYAGEFEFRWNTRKVDDGQRREIALKQTVGRRLQYRDPVDKE